MRNILITVEGQAAEKKKAGTPVRELLPSLRFGVLWSLVQYPLVILLAQVSGLSLTEGVLAAAAITGC